MRPLEAYEAVMRFAAERGEPALRLALHAAVPQSFRPDLLHLIRLNFVSEATHETEADVLLAPFCEDTGGGYYQLDPEARRQLLDHLDPTYPGERVSRVQRVADFLVTSVALQHRRLSADQDRLAEDYFSIQGWVALAFLQPEAAALQLAAALDQGTQGELAARVQFSGLAGALSVPLARYPKLLTYAAGLEALEQGRAADALDLLERLPDEELKIGWVTLRSPRELLAQREAGREQRTEAASSTSYGRCFISYPFNDREFVDWLRPALQSYGVHVWSAPHDLEGGASSTLIPEAIRSADVFLLVLSRRFSSSHGANLEVEIAQKADRPIITLLVDSSQEGFSGFRYVVDFSQQEGYKQSLATLLYLLKTVGPSTPQSNEPTSHSVLTGSLEGKRKQVTVLFCDLLLDAGLRSRVGAEAMHLLVNRSFELCMQLIAPYGATVNRYQGGGILAVFESPIGHTDHARRAVLAAVSLQKASGVWSTSPVGPYGLELKGVTVRMGLNTGRVDLDDGGSFRMEHSVEGATTIGLALGLQQTARSGMVLISESTCELVRDRVRVQRFTINLVEGSGEPVQAYRVLGLVASEDSALVVMFADPLRLAEEKILNHPLVEFRRTLARALAESLRLDHRYPPRPLSPMDISGHFDIALSRQLDFSIILTRRMAVDFLNALGRKTSLTMLKRRYNAKSYRDFFGRGICQVGDSYVFTYAEILHMEKLDVHLKLSDVLAQL